MSLSRDGAVALITIDYPPVNALSKDVRIGLVAALEGAIADKTVRAIVLACAGKSFCAGADIREFDLAPQPPHLTDVIQRFADAGKPVVAALHGSALSSQPDATIASRHAVRGSDCPKSILVCCPAPAGRSACRGWSVSMQRCP